MQPFEDPTQPPAEHEHPTPDVWAELSEPSLDAVSEAELDQLDEEFLIDADEPSDELDEVLLVRVDEPEVTVEVAAPEVMVEVAEPEPVATSPGLDLDAIAADLDGVEVALSRLAEGAYWNDEVTGEPLPPELLAQSPTARRAG